jgi:hypothetical protein
MGARGKEKSSFSLTKFTDTNSYIEIYKNQIIKMREKFRILVFPLFILFTLIGEIILMSLLGSLDFLFSFDPVLLAVLISIKIYCNAEADKAKIIQENKDKSGIYM